MLNINIADKSTDESEINLTITVNDNIIHVTILY